MNASFCQHLQLPSRLSSEDDLRATLVQVAAKHSLTLSGIMCLVAYLASIPSSLTLKLISTSDRVDSGDFRA